MQRGMQRWCRSTTAATATTTATTTTTTTTRTTTTTTTTRTRTTTTTTITTTTLQVLKEVVKEQRQLHYFMKWSDQTKEKKMEGEQQATGGGEDSCRECRHEVGTFGTSLHDGGRHWSRDGQVGGGKVQRVEVVPH